MVYLIGSFLSIQLFLLSSVKCFAVFLLLLLFFSLMTILFGFLSPLATLPVLRRFVSSLFKVLI